MCVCVSKSVPKTHSQQTMVPRSSLYKELQGMYSLKKHFEILSVALSKRRCDWIESTQSSDSNVHGLVMLIFNHLALAFLQKHPCQHFC